MGKRSLPAVRLCCSWLVLASLLAGCGGGGGSKPSGTSTGGSSRLLRTEYGRLVDIYAYRRVETTIADRRRVDNRTPVLVAKDVVVSANIESQPLFDAIGGERVDADYRFLTYDVKVGHEELCILWDDQVIGEKARFAAALQKATSFLNEIPASYRDQNTNQKPIPVVPRNAAILLTFDRNLGLDDAFFAANPTALQVLEFKADPKTTNPIQAFRPVLARVISKGSQLVVDTTLIGGEAKGGQTTTGLPVSTDNMTANLRLALPTTGLTSRQFRVEPDTVTVLNGADSRGDTAVIRDFRSGNPADGRVGALTDTEAPMIVGHIGMGIVAIDPNQKVLTLNKRFAKVAVRGRVPFVDGAYDETGTVPSGPSKTPTDQPLRTGDLIYQDVEVGGGKIVRLRAEVVQNMDVGSKLNDPTYPVLGLDANGTDAGNAPTVRVKVASLTYTEPGTGAKYSFQASDLPLGADCTVRVHYYENVPYNSNFGSAAVTDTARRNEFLVVDPAPPVLDKNRNPIPRGEQVDPLASVSVRFSEPMDLVSVEPLNNYLLSNRDFDDSNFAARIQDPKGCTVSILAVRLSDEENDGTLLRLTPPMGFFHVQGKPAEDDYWFHVRLGETSVKDLSGNALDVFDRRLQAISNFSAKFKLTPEAKDNLVGWRIYRFEDLDEDGTPPGSVDVFGQFKLSNGKLSAAGTTRFSAIVDGQTMPSILRGDKGECVDQTGRDYGPWGPLYQTPSMIQVQPAPPRSFQPPINQPQSFGGIVEPHQPRGSKLHMTYIEDDFALSYTDPNAMLLDVEQLYWASWRGAPALFDVFDRYTLALGHSDYRPDLTAELTPPPNVACALACPSLVTGLRPGFAGNVLEGTKLVEVVKDKVYTINPNESFTGATGTVFTPYPRFTKSYTWRDSRLVTWDTANNRAVGLGGAHSPAGIFPAQDWTTNVDSPWVPSLAPGKFTGPAWAVDQGDFQGARTRDHDPIALPLLVECNVYPDDIQNGFASGANLFHIGHIGPAWPPAGPLGTGYYNAVGVTPCGGLDWPQRRAHTTGGFDPQNNLEVAVNPDFTLTAIGGWIKDMGYGDPNLGLFKSKYGDDHVHWAQADFVRKVSMVTFGFIDTLKPNQSLKLQGYDPNGRPDFASLQSGGSSLRIKDFLTVVDPPATAQPAGTSVAMEFRGANSFTNSDKVYDKTVSDLLATRGNVMNPSYAADAYRCAMPNPGFEIAAGAHTTAVNTPRITADGLTPYVVENKLDTLRDPRTQVLPRFLNYRIVMENNTAVKPATSPILRSVAWVFRMAKID